MEQSLAERGDGDELIDTQLGVCIRRTADYSPTKHATAVWYEPYSGALRHGWTIKNALLA